MSDRLQSAETQAVFDDGVERAVLGCLLAHQDQAIATLGPRLDPALFFSNACRVIFEGMLAVIASGAPLDLITLNTQLRGSGKLEEAGGPHELAQLKVRHECSVTLAEYHLDSLKERAAGREAIQVSQRVAAAALDGSLDSAALASELHRSADAILALGRERKSSLPAMDDACEMRPEDIGETPSEVIEGLLHEGSKAVVGGGSKSFKTWILTDLGVSVATGEPWLGFPTRKGRVLYINLEIQRGFFAQRLQHVRKARGISLAKGQLSVWTLRGHAADLSALLPEIVRQAKSENFSLIVIDPIYKVMGGRDENAAGDIGSLLNEIERLAVQTGAAVVFGAHFSKGNQAGKESMDRIGGSGVFARDPDSILVLTKHEEDDAFTVETTLRNHPPVEPFVVRWQFPLMQRDGSLDPTKLKVITGRPKTHTAEDLFEQLDGRELTFSQWAKAAHEHAGISKGTFVTLRAELIKSGRVRQSAIDQTYYQVKKVNKSS